MLRALVEHYVRSPRATCRWPEPGAATRLHAAVAYVDGMTDRFACAQATALLGWPSDRLPRGLIWPDPGSRNRAGTSRMINGLNRIDSDHTQSKTGGGAPWAWFTRRAPQSRVHQAARAVHEGRPHLPVDVLPPEGMDAEEAYDLITSDLLLDGSARLNLATFVTTSMPAPGRPCSWPRRRTKT